MRNVRRMQRNGMDKFVARAVPIAQSYLDGEGDKDLPGLVERMTQEAGNLVPDGPGSERWRLAFGSLMFTTGELMAEYQPEDAPE